jgi:hypothetical protein
MTQRLLYIELLEWVVEQVVQFPREQKRAMICFLQDMMRNKMGNLPYLVHLFKQQDVDITSIEWPMDKEQKKSLRTSLHHARKRLADLYYKKLERDDL